MIPKCTSLRWPSNEPKNRGETTSSCWAIVLAGGDGTRMRPFIKNWLGEDRPKQYCTFLGSRSMLQHTLDRASALVPRDNIVTVIGKGHGAFLSDADLGSYPGTILEQPSNRGTAPGVYFAASYIRAIDPTANIIVLPSDHFIHPENILIDHLGKTTSFARNFRNRLILIGAIPNRAETEYGWIEPDLNSQNRKYANSKGGLFGVRGFHEKPPQHVAESLMRRGSLWNTMIMVGDIPVFWSLGRRSLPEMMDRVEKIAIIWKQVLSGRMNPDRATTAIVQIYSNMPAADFSRDLLQRSIPSLALYCMDNLTWCDWGKPDRITETCRNFEQITPTSALRR